MSDLAFNDLMDLSASVVTEGCRLFVPYEKQKQFFKLGKKHDTRTLSGANRVGKTFAFYRGELPFHLTGEYPNWWNGHRFERPITAWVGSTDFTTNVSGCQKALVGDLNKDRLGLAEIDPITGAVVPCGLPLDTILRIDKHAQIKGALTGVLVRHKSGGESFCRFISYIQSQEKLQAGKVDIVGMDEEPPMSIYNELILRTFDSQGLNVLTFTPLKGISEVVQQQIGNVVINEEFPHIIENETGALIRISMHDVPHLTEKMISKLKSKIPDHQHMARIEGIPAVGEGLIYPFKDEALRMQVTVPPVHWQVVDALDFGTQHPTCRVRMYYDKDNETFYLTQVYRVSNLTPTVHAANWDRLFSGHVPVAWPHDGAKRVDALKSDDLIALSEKYRSLGVYMLEAPVHLPSGGIGREAGIEFIYEAMEQGRFKVFANCVEFFEEKALYRREKKSNGVAEIVKVADDVMDAVRYAVMSLLCGESCSRRQAYQMGNKSITRTQAIAAGKRLPPRDDDEDGDGYDFLNEGN